jgi:hypothetical protein
MVAPHNRAARSRRLRRPGRDEMMETLATGEGMPEVDAG